MGLFTASKSGPSFASPATWIDGFATLDFSSAKLLSMFGPDDTSDMTSSLLQSDAGQVLLEDGVKGKDCGVGEGLGAGAPVPELATGHGTPESEEGLSGLEATCNLVNTVVGVGVLSVPYAFRLSGYSTFALLLAVIAVTSLTGKYIGASLVLAASSPEAVDVPPKSRDYGFLAFVAFGPRGRMLMRAVTCMETWFALCTFAVMNGVNMALLVPTVGRGHAVIAGGILTAITSLVPLQTFSYLSLVSLVALLVACVSMVITGLMVESWADPYVHPPPTWSVLSNAPRSTGLLVFCFAGHPCFPMVHEAMRDKRSWGLSMNATFLIAFLFYGGLGVFGYDVFGSSLQASFTENLGAVHSAGAWAWRDATVLAFLVKIQLTAPLLLKVTLVSMWAPSHTSEWPFGRILLFVCLVAVTIVTGVVLADDVFALASLTGSLFVMMTSVIFPIAVYIRLRHLYGQTHGRRTQTWILHSCILALGVFMAFTGTVSAVRDLYRKS